MNERLRDPIWWLRIVCAALGLLVAVQLFGALFGSDPSAGMEASIAALPGAGPGDPAAGARDEVPAAFGPITERKIFGKVEPRPPQPAVLEGIAYDVALIRSPRGRTGMLHVGETVDGVKLLRIGVNRVLVEVNGEEKELTIHQGLGGRALLPEAPKPAPPPRPTASGK